MANRRVVSLRPDGGVDVLAERYEGKRLNRPNDVICRSDGTLLFTDPGMRTPLAGRELPYSGVYSLTLDGDLALVADCEYPNGLAFSPDESTLYVANSRWAQYIHALTLDSSNRMVRRRIFADMSTDDEPTDAEALYRGTAANLGVPDGMKVDSAGRVFCTGRGGVWVFDPFGERIGIIPMPEVCANLAFGGPDLCTLFLTASTSVYSLRVRTPGQPHPYQVAR
jgi:gluconolactonase